MWLRHLLAESWTVQLQIIYVYLHTLPTDELGDWCHQRLVGALCKYQAQRGGSMATLWAGTSIITLKQLQWRNLPDTIPTMNHFLWGVGRAGCWIGKQRWEKQWSTSSTEQANCRYGDQSSDPSKVVIHKDQHRRQLKLWRLELTCKHMVRQALAATPQITETTGHIGSRLT